MTFIPGESYDMTIKNLLRVGNTDIVFYVLAYTGRRFIVFDFEKNIAHRKKTIKCIYQGQNEFGKDVFIRDMYDVLNDLYEDDTICTFKYYGIEEDSLTHKPYHRLKDNFGLEHHFHGEVSDISKDNKIDLYVLGIDKPSGQLILKEKDYPEHGEADYLREKYIDFIETGGEEILDQLSTTLKINTAFNDWVALYRMAQELKGGENTLYAIRKEIIGTIDANVLSIGFNEIGQKIVEEKSDIAPTITIVEESIETSLPKDAPNTSATKQEEPEQKETAPKAITEIVQPITIEKNRNHEFMISYIAIDGKISLNNSPSSLFKHICAMLNSEGGHIFIGCDENGNVKGLHSEFLYYGSMESFSIYLKNEIERNFGKKISNAIGIEMSSAASYCKITIPSYYLPVSYEHRFWTREDGKTVIVPDSKQIAFALTKTAI